MQPGTYKAKVKVTDAGGASTTSEEITITVANPPGNAAPSVEALADPTSGTAPLRVRFTSSSTSIRTATSSCRCGTSATA